MVVCWVWSCERVVFSFSGARQTSYSPEFCLLYTLCLVAIWPLSSPLVGFISCIILELHMTFTLPINLLCFWLCGCATGGALYNYLYGLAVSLL